MYKNRKCKKVETLRKSEGSNMKRGESERKEIRDALLKER